MITGILIMLGLAVVLWTGALCAFGFIRQGMIIVAWSLFGLLLFALL